MSFEKMMFKIATPGGARNYSSMFSLDVDAKNKNSWIKNVIPGVVFLKKSKKLDIMTLPNSLVTAHCFIT